MFFVVKFLLPGPGAACLCLEKSLHRDSGDLSAFFFGGAGRGSCGMSDNLFPLPRPQILPLQILTWLRRVVVRRKRERTPLFHSAANNRRADRVRVIYNLLLVRVSLSTIGVRLKQCDPLAPNPLEQRLLL